ncbi:MAG: ferrous iron transport protein B [Ruminococcus sp.]|nr:ferrous iron transport protein B [Ruminococcus sp.]
MKPQSPSAGAAFTVALAGNPNVGKSTLFNALTGMHQHTGNWAGKTVQNAIGRCTHQNHTLLLVDLPGTYSLQAQSAEEQTARDFICFAGADVAIITCDASCLERNLILALQIMETGCKAMLCVNLLDEAQKRRISVDLERLEQQLNIPVAGIVARKKEGLTECLNKLCALLETDRPVPPVHIPYPAHVEEAAGKLEAALRHADCLLNPRWTALRLLEGDSDFAQQLALHGEFLLTAPAMDDLLEETGLHSENAARLFSDEIISGVVQYAEKICRDVLEKPREHQSRDRRIDRILLGKYTGFPIMLLMLGLILWITIVLANVPSQWLQTGFSALGEVLHRWMADAPHWLRGALLDGIYNVLTWVISVMLPPMAIFFPLFTLLEDFGYLPRVAFQLDKCFQCAGACGRQALTMCMGLGCNAAGITGCRIIESPRERLIAILTNVFVPCNGRFPTLIALITAFFTAGAGGSLLSAAGLTLLILLGIVMTLLVSKLLSMTLLRGLPSAITLELPPYRRPQVLKVLVRSLLDRTLFVLGRACAVAAPAGLLLWILANVSAGGASILSHIAGFLEAPGRFMGLDGEILTAFLLGFPANEIVLPIAAMLYQSSNVLTETGSTDTLREILLSNGWTQVTALCTMLFMLFHFPCSTACLTIRKETGRIRWMLLGMALPTLCGVILCVLTVHIAALF